MWKNQHKNAIYENELQVSPWRGSFVPNSCLPQRRLGLVRYVEASTISKISLKLTSVMIDAASARPFMTSYLHTFKRTMFNL